MNTSGAVDSRLIVGPGTYNRVACDWDNTQTDTFGILDDSGSFGSLTGGIWTITNRLMNSEYIYDDASSFQFGAPGDRAICGNWDGTNSSARDSIGVFRPSTATFYLRNSNSAGPVDIGFQWGATGDVPIVGDWDGNGGESIGVIRF